MVFGTADGLDETVLVVQDSVLVLEARLADGKVAVWVGIGGCGEGHAF